MHKVPTTKKCAYVLLKYHKHRNCQKHKRVKGLSDAMDTLLAAHRLRAPPTGKTGRSEKAQSPVVTQKL